MDGKRWISISIGVGFLGMVAFSWAFSDPHEMSPKNNLIRNIHKVHTASVRQERHQYSACFSGVIQACERAVLAFSVTGRMVDKLVVNGSHIKKGQIIASLDETEYRNTLLAAEASRSRAKRSMASGRARL